MNTFSRYKMRCRRGMKELDFVLERYLDTHFSQASTAEIQCFDELLELQDPTLFGILFGTEPTPEHFQQLADKIRAFH